MGAKNCRCLLNLMKTSAFLRLIIVCCCSIFAWCGGFCPELRAQGYMGANAVLQLAQQRRAKSATETNDDQAKFRAELKAFTQNSTNLAPADAARQWLDFVDRVSKLPPQAQQNANPSSQPISGNDLLCALPPPAAWNILAQDISARPPAKGDDELREIGLGFLAATLTGDVQMRNAEMTNLEIKASNAGEQDSYVYNQLLQQLSQAVMATSDDPDAILSSLQNQIASATAENTVTLDVPNLASEVGPAKAETFLRTALVAPNVVLQFDQPNETSHLAQKLALELVNQLKMPQWGLVNSLDAIDLYEALAKRFGNGTNTTMAMPGLPVSIDVSPPAIGGNDQTTARVYYMLGLISKGRTQDAVAVAKKFKGYPGSEFDNTFAAMDSAGYADELDAFLHELLSQSPTLPFWSEYVQFSAKAGQTDRMLALVRATLARNDLSNGRKAALRQILCIALLASDNVEGGVQQLRWLIASNTPAPPGEENYNPGQLGVLLARIGILMTNAEWMQEGVVAVTNWLASAAAQNSSDREAGNVISSISQILLQLGRGPEAEAILANALGSVTTAWSGMQPDVIWNQDRPPRQLLSTLTVLYYKARRYDDVLILLQNSPDWAANDLSELFSSDPWADSFSVMSLHSGGLSLPIPYIVADSLRAKGRIEEARRITDALLVQEPALDRGYELLIALEGTNAIPHLDQLFQSDQFQTRPLIWKAYLLEQEGRLEEAEKTVRQAISIDPSDGESGRGDRMRAYAELADIREALGDWKEADFHREIVKAIRISEDADQYYLAGLLKRAITMYREGLDHFANAYCIQSRMAIQLAALGKTAEAEEHYRRAYELMPDSFGRVESHCFGCERVFDGQQAQSVAEKVFKQLVAERPRKPQVYYLLGYLYMEENRYKEAWPNFQTAVRLDPDYLNAWVEMQTIDQQILVPPQQRDKIVLNILRLDPLQHHSSPGFNEVTDIGRLWDAVNAASKLQPQPPANLFELTASKFALENRINALDPRMATFETMQSQSEQDNQILSPGQAIAQNPFISLAGQLILNGNLNLNE